MAAGVFADKGYARTDLQVIADRLKIGKGTVYRYFPTKDDLFFATVDHLMKSLQARVNVDTLPVSDPLDRIGQAVRSYLAFCDAHPEFVELLVQERAVFRDRKHPTYFEHRAKSQGPWKILIRELIRKERIRNVPVRRIVDVLSDLCYGTIFTNHFAKRRISFQTQSEDILDLAFYGILSDAERRKAPPGTTRKALR